MGKVHVNDIKPGSPQGLDHAPGLTADLSQRHHFLKFESN